MGVRASTVKRREVTINQDCTTTPVRPSLSKAASGTKKILWKSASNRNYTVELPGGVFKDHAADFTLNVPASPDKSDVLTLAGGVSTGKRKYRITGTGCLPRGGEAPSAKEIIIGP
jgi:hypothetical protein